ncbi:colorectal mutant cancer protein isoform X1 [Schistocerca cancellata]|uniref:colorectal mutant cancer protein isoform X1 n=1 Tax=Schistocerca cancellata TaxID=274614 RepID=UPI002119A0E1|nr:colorectal mutant cancer protein isoform X1 [Schistocerca cancellata]
MADNTEQNSELYAASEDASSLCDEDRVRKLFQACDGDGDGYIDSQDLLTVCRELNLEDSLEELMRELGADDQGRISYQEFLRRRLALRPEIDALRGHTAAGARDYLPASSDNSLGAASAGKHESWEFDSGARDLSPEPHTLQKLVEAAGGSLTAGSPASMLDLANKLHLAALASLKGEILDLSNRLHTVTQERDLLEKTLNKTQLEKLRLVAETEERAELQAQRYEERLTELHSVIAELTRKIERQRSLVIREEEDVISENENEDQDLSRDAEGSTTNLVDDSELQDPDRTIGDPDSSNSDNEHQADNEEEPDEEACIVPDPPDEEDCTSGEPDTTPLAEPEHSAVQQLQQQQQQQTEMEGEGLLSREAGTSCRSLQLAGLAEELAQQRAEAAALRERLERQGHELQQARASIATLRADRDRLRKKVREMEPKGSPEHRCLSSSPTACTPNNLSVVPQDDTPVCKVAERVVLRKMDHHITGSQLASLGVCSTKVAETLVSELQEADLQELTHGEAAVRRQFEVETERLNSRVEHLRAQNTVLALTLEDSKSQCDRLSLLLGKYESNATALRLALGYSDRAIEAYDVLVALLESELGLLLANCRAAGIGKFAGKDESKDSENDAVEIGSLLRRASENRRATETVARHLLARLEATLASNAINISTSPWEEYSHTTSTSSSGECSEWGQNEERRLRDHIGKLKAERSAVRATVVELESCHAEPPSPRPPVSIAEARKLDLETAVLMQELMAMREDKAELRARVYLLEKERASLELKLSSMDAHHAAQLATIQHLQSQLQETEQLLNSHSKEKRKVITMDDNECVEEMTSELSEALRREARLKERLQELVSTLEKVSKNSEMRHQQSADLVNDLKKANSALVQTLERSKKKYQTRLKKLEQQMLAMVDRHASQVRTLKQRICILEEETCAHKVNNYQVPQIPPSGSHSQSSGASETSL